LGAQEPGGGPQTQVALQNSTPKACPTCNPAVSPCRHLPYPAPAQAPVTQSREFWGNKNNSYAIANNYYNNNDNDDKVMISTVKLQPLVTAQA